MPICKQVISRPPKRVLVPALSAGENNLKAFWQVEDLMCPTGFVLLDSSYTSQFKKTIITRSLLINTYFIYYKLIRRKADIVPYGVIKLSGGFRRAPRASQLLLIGQRRLRFSSPCCPLSSSRLPYPPCPPNPPSAGRKVGVVPPPALCAGSRRAPCMCTVSISAKIILNP